MPTCPHCGTQVRYCPVCGQLLTAGDAQAELILSPFHAEHVLWECKPGVRAGLKSQTTTYRVTSQRVQIVREGFAHKVEEIDLTHLREARVARAVLQRGSSGNLLILGDAPTASMLMFEDIPDPEQVRKLIVRASQALRQRQAAQGEVETQEPGPRCK